MLSTVNLLAVQWHKIYRSKLGVNLYRLGFITAEYIVL